MPGKNNWLDPKTIALKKLLFQLLQTKYTPHDDLVSRVCSALVTENDITSFSKLVADIYEIGYLKAVADYSEQLKAMNIKVKITQKNLVDNQ